MSNREITLRLDERWYQALCCQLEETVESKLTDYLDHLISLLPSDIYDKIDEIDEEMYEEQQRQKQERVAARQYSAFRVTENGVTEHFRVGPMDLLDSASCVRRWLEQTEQRPFQELLPGREKISPEKYDQIAAGCVGEDQKIIGVYDVDLDIQEFSHIKPDLGWVAYQLKDVDCADGFAYYRSGGYDRARRYDRLTEYLADREVPSAGHLSAKNISFAGEIMEEHGQINFYLENCFDVNRVFGIRTAGGDDALNMYANYDMAAGQVCDELELTLIRADGHEESLSYPLNVVEKAVLLRRMDAYCQEQTGQSLADYSAQRLAEDMVPPAGPVM